MGVGGKHSAGHPCGKLTSSEKIKGSNSRTNPGA